MQYLHVLVVDDEPALRQILARALAKEGHTVTVAENGEQALVHLEKGDVDVALCDIRMPDYTGLEVVSRARQKGIDTAFLMMTAFASVNTAVEAMRAGAYDYMIKPIRNEDLFNRLANIADIIGLRSENRELRDIVLKEEGSLSQSQSPAMQRIHVLMNKVAVTDSTVLITGESGTGKGVLAKRLHQSSLRAGKRIVSVNCGAIPENLVESEFFGHTKGAFTGAYKAKRGLFVEADEGTIFLDEIGELPLSMQVKLLHVIEDKNVRAVGSEQVRKVNVRIVAATNRDLYKMVEEGRFREDLYFRLNVFNLNLPPLRERQIDIPSLVDFFIRQHFKNSSVGKLIEFSQEAMNLLALYNYPGNVRELENIIARAVIIAVDDIIRPEDLPDSVQQAEGALSVNGQLLRDQVRRFEVEVIERAIAEAGGDRKMAARRLGVGLSSLYRKLELNPRISEEVNT